MLMMMRVGMTKDTIFLSIQVSPHVKERRVDERMNPSLLDAPPPRRCDQFDHLDEQHVECHDLIVEGERGKKGMEANKN